MDQGSQFQRRDRFSRDRGARLRIVRRVDPAGALGGGVGPLGATYVERVRRGWAKSLGPCLNEEQAYGLYARVHLLEMAITTIDAAYHRWEGGEADIESLVRTIPIAVRAVVADGNGSRADA